ncbi:MAG: glycoside hydrolase family 5 protein [Dictyoglomaceae bacterium]
MRGKNPIPRWRGFNLPNMFSYHYARDFEEEDFKWISEWGFDFVRIPLNYRLWIDGDDVHKIKEEVLKKIDEVVEWGQKYKIHVCLNFHRAPGYCVNNDLSEKFNLWKDDEALNAFCYHWGIFTKRYRGISSKDLSFNLINEPPNPSERGMSREDHERVIRRTVDHIRNIDPGRFIIIDGISYGNEPLPELSNLLVAQSCRGYLPMGLTHYKASWVGGENWPKPTWPLAWHYGESWDRRRLEEHYDRWASLMEKGIGVHCGEAGAFKYTPHNVVLSWMKDLLEILKERDIGFALWNFKGPFGILDSEREDVEYEDWYGHKLDKKMLNLLQGN